MQSEVFLLVASFPDSVLRFRGALIEALLNVGCQVHVAAPGLSVGSPIAVALGQKGVAVHDIPLTRTGLNPLRDLSTMLALRRLMRTIGACYVLGYTVKPVVYGTLAARLAGVPHRFALVTGLGYAFTGDARGLRQLLRRLVQQLYRFALSRSHKVFFQNPDDEALFRTLSIVPASLPSCVVNGSGVDLTEYIVAPLPGQPVFLLIARLLGDKGVREYALAAQRVKQQYPSARFLLVGWIDDNPDAINQRELDKWIEDGVVEYLGKLSDVRPAIAKSSVYVLPSYREGTPRTVLEAMAMGRAIITTDAPGCRETVNEGENGYLVPVKNIDALVSAMGRFIESPGLATSMGAKSRAITEQKYDVHQVNAVMLNEMGIR